MRNIFEKKQQYQNIKDDIDSGSITPSTHQERILFTSDSLGEYKDDQENQMIQQKDSNDPSIDERQEYLVKKFPILKSYSEQNFIGIKDLTEDYFIDKYQLFDQNVIRYGINVYSEENQRLVKIFNASPSESNRESKTTKAKSLQLTSTQKSKQEQIQDEKILNHIETNLIQYAIEKGLLSYKHRAIVIDIFDKDKDGLIKMNDDNTPKTHSVILYMHNNCKFTLIDPNNSDFSKHIASDLNRSLIFTKTDKYFAQHDIFPEINVLDKVQIYNVPQGKETGRNLDQWRDCIDIAVKLTAHLNNHKYTLDIKDILHTKVFNKAIINISNNPEIDTYAMKDLPLKGKQSSNNDQNYIKSMIKIKKAQEYMEALSGRFGQEVDPWFYTTNMKKLSECYNSEGELNTMGEINQSIYDLWI